MRRLLLAGAAAAAGLLSSSLAQAGANLIQNGNFATGTASPWFITGTASNSFITKDPHYGATVAPPPGDEYMFAAGDDVYLFQTFATTVGDSYTLS